MFKAVLASFIALPETGDVPWDFSLFTTVQAAAIYISVSVTFF